MFILIHVVVALATLAGSTIAVARPSRSIIGTSYGLLLATLASGTYLIVFGNAQIMQTCLTGLLFVAVCGTCLVAARRRLAAYARADV